MLDEGLAVVRAAGRKARESWGFERAARDARAFHPMPETGGQALSQ